MSLEEVIERIEQRLAGDAPAKRSDSPDNRVAPSLEALTANPWRDRAFAHP